jgi:hypothetical protein
MRSLGRGLRRSEFGGVPGRIPELNDKFRRTWLRLGSGFARRVATRLF